mgnify:FL=1
MSVWEFIIAFAVAAGICTAIMLIANLIYEAYEKRKFRRECEKMFDFYDRMRELADSGNGDLATELINLRDKINDEKGKTNDI